MSELQQGSVDPWGRAPGRSLSSAPYRAAYRHWFRVAWEGLEHVPRQGGALLVANHAGMMPVDGAIVQQGIEEERRRSVYSLAHHGFWRFPFVGRLLANSGAVVGHPDNAQRLLAQERQLVLVFPEGSKGPVKPPAERYRLQRFGRGGFVETALRAGVPIVPIVLCGTEDTTPVLATVNLLGQRVPITLQSALFGPLGSFLHLPARIRVRVLEPVRFEEPSGLDGYPRSLVMDRSEAIRERMQAALDDMLLRRKSIWSG